MVEVQKIKWAILISNWGRSAMKVMESWKQGRLLNNEISLLIYENLPSGAVDLANELGIETIQVVKKDYSNRQAYEAALTEKLRERNIDYIFLLGFGYMLKHDLLESFSNRIVNVHPALLPSFKGKRAIQQALNYGVRVTGLTTHLIDDKLDEGKIVCQKAIEIEENDNFESLDNKFMLHANQLLEDTICYLGKSVKQPIIE